MPLKMANGVSVRTIEDLRSNFDLSSVVGYFLDGKLLTWLNARYYDEESKMVEALSEKDKNLAKKLCEILKVNYSGEEISVEQILLNNEKLTKLKQYEVDEEVINNIANVAFTQQELDVLIEMHKYIHCDNPSIYIEIYLFNGTYTIPTDCNNVIYHGIGDVTAVIKSKKIILFDEQNITFDNIKFDEKYEKVMASAVYTTYYNKLYCCGLYSDKNGNLCVSNRGVWSASSDENIIDISAKDSSYPVAVYDTGEIWAYDDIKRFVSVPVKQVMMNNSRLVMFIGTDGYVYEWNDNTRPKFKKKSQLNDIIQLSYGGYGNLFLKNDGKIYNRDGLDEEYFKNYKIKKIVDCTNALYGLDDNGTIFYHSGVKLHIPEMPEIVDIASSTYKTYSFLYALDKQGRVYWIGRETDYKEHIDELLRQLPPIKRLLGNGVIGVGTDGKVYDMKFGYTAESVKSQNRVFVRSDISSIYEPKQ